jgi:hypothetical protein
MLPGLATGLSQDETPAAAPEEEEKKSGKEEERGEEEIIAMEEEIIEDSGRQDDRHQWSKGLAKLGDVEKVEWTMTILGDDDTRVLHGSGVAATRVLHRSDTDAAMKLANTSVERQNAIMEDITGVRQTPPSGGASAPTGSGWRAEDWGASAAMEMAKLQEKSIDAKRGLKRTASIQAMEMENTTYDKQSAILAEIQAGPGSKSMSSPGLGAAESDDLDGSNRTSVAESDDQDKVIRSPPPRYEGDPVETDDQVENEVGMAIAETVVAEASRWMPSGSTCAPKKMPKLDFMGRSMRKRFDLLQAKHNTEILDNDTVSKIGKVIDDTVPKDRLEVESVPSVSEVESEVEPKVDSEVEPKVDSSGEVFDLVAELGDVNDEHVIAEHDGGGGESDFPSQGSLW